MKDLIEIRWHGRGGQGAKTCNKRTKKEGAIVINTTKSIDELRPLLKGYEGRVYTIDARKNI